MLELPRHTEVDPGVPPLLPTRRMSELHVTDLVVLDLTNELALTYLHLSAKELIAGYAEDPEAELCREIADEARRRSDVEGLLVPSAALPRGGGVLVIFPDAFPKVTVGDQQVVRLVIMPEPKHPPIPRPPRPPDPGS